MLKIGNLTGFGSAKKGFSDNFNDNSQNTSLWNKTFSLFSGYDASVTVNETSNQLQITPLSSTSGSHYNGYESVRTYDFTNKTVLIEVPQVLSGNASGIDTRFALMLDTDNYMSFNHVGTGSLQQLVFRVRTTGTNSETNVTYSGASHLWWRFRHSATSLYFETSTDGISWTTRRTVTEPSWAITGLKVVLAAGTFGSIASPGSTIFDNFYSNLI